MPKRRRRPQRRKKRADKRPRSSTIEESSSSTDRVNSQRKRAQCHKEPTPPSSRVHIQTATALHLHINTFRWLLSSHGAPRTGHFSLFCHPQPRQAECGKLSLARALLNTQGRGGESTLESVSVKRRTQDLPHTPETGLTEQPNATHRRINEAGDSVPSSQDSVTRAVRNLRISDSPATLAALPAPPPSTIRNARRPPRPKQKPRDYLRCAQCGPVADARWALTDGGLMQHVGQKHEGQTLLEDSVGQTTALTQSPGLCVLRHSQVAVVSPMQLLRKRHSFPRISRWGHLPGQTTAQASGRSGQRTGTWAATSSELAASASRRTYGRQPASELPPSTRDVALTDREKHLLTELRRASAMALSRCVVSRHVMAWAESRRSHERTPVLGSPLSVPLSR